LSEGVLPAPAVAQLDEWQRDVSLVTCEPGYRLQVASPEVLQALRRRAPFRRRTRPFASRQEAWVSRGEAKALFRYLRRLGYVPVLPSDGDDDTPPIAPALRPVLPLPQLLVALRTYHHLRGQIPGLAPLGLEALEADIAAALAPSQLAGARQLVESHAILLAWDIPPAVERAESEGGQAAEKEAAQLENAEAVVDRAAQAAPDSPPVRSTGGARGGPTLAPPVNARELLPLLQAAIDAASPVELVYADAQARVTVRPVRPLRLEERQGRQILVAYCELRQDERHFRLDRIIRLQSPTGRADPEPLPFPE
jgi:hypothetical protein